MSEGQPTPQIPFGDAFGKVVENLREEKPFLYGIAGAILVIAVGALGLTGDTIVMIGVIGVLLVGAVLWLAWQARQVQTGTHPKIKLRIDVDELEYDDVDAQNVRPAGLNVDIDARATGKNWKGKRIRLQNVGMNAADGKTEDEARE